MKLKYFSKIILSTSIVILTMLVWGCRDDFKLSEEREVIEGLPANIHISLSVSDMDIRTRNAGTLPAQANEVKNLWVGIFNEGNNGEKINDLVILSSEKVEEHKRNGKINIDLTAYSGKVYIVAVANAQGKKYYLPKKESGDATDKYIGTTDRDLLEILQDKELTWEDYRNIATALSNPRDITRQGTESFIMSGYYTEGNVTNPAAGHPKYVTPTSVSPGENEGVIHLRRLDAYNLFQIHVNENITFTPISWQVVNIPALSFVQERDGGNQTNVNASDCYLDDVSEFEGYESAYHNSEVYEAQWFDRSTTGKRKNYQNPYTFDFYIRENKHTGILDKIDELKELREIKYYNYREWEFKNGENNGSVTNTGWYRSLVTKQGGNEAVPTKWDSNEDLWNNNATYVVLHAKMEYFYLKDDNEKKPVEITESNKNRCISRTADVTYTIHLGYCEGNSELDKANDFNCRRNTDYTYNVLIKGADNITVEAISNQLDGENFQHGMEGMVTDQFDAKTIHLDSHYGVFNIQLSKAERENLEWAIETPFGDTSYRFYYNEGTVTINNKSIDISELRNNQFYNWIQIRPTTGENILADYPGDPRLKGSKHDTGEINDWAQTSSDEGVWGLAELADPYKFPHPDGAKDGDQDKRSYTIFIDEYVYENGKLGPDFSSTGADVKDNWYNFVNYDDRKFWLYYVHGPYISADGKSIYNDANFELTQESIQSYYSSDRVRLTQQSGDNIGIFGVESLNESYKKDWDYAQKDLNRYNWEMDNLDGLYNTYQYSLQLSGGWNEVYTSDNTLRNGNEDNADEEPKTFYIRDHDDYFMNACLARNRDLNNNGQIDDNEIRWYLPTDQTYTRIILGTTSLRSPMFDAKSMPQSSITPGSGTLYSHYAASNKRQTWAEELAATGVLDRAGNLRCIRNLGLKTDVKPGTGEYKTPTPAFIHDKKEHTIEMYYFRAAALRSYTSSTLGPHSIIDKNAFTSRKFKYASDYCRPGVNLVQGYSNNSNTLQLLDGSNKVGTANFRDQYESGQRIPVEKNKWSQSLVENSICKYYHDKSDDLSDVGQWRVPNITELGLIFLNGVLSEFDGTNYYISSSYEYFLKQDGTRGNYYMGVNQNVNDITAWLDAARVICVKDIQTNY